jgi:FAD/FMN-containing dehydrogenase
MSAIDRRTAIEDADQGPTGFTGPLLRPGDDGYDEAARVFFATGRPELVVRPATADDVAAALHHAVRRDLAVSVRSGGHSPVGHSTNTGGMVIDLARLDAVDVLDADRRLVRVGGGATWGTVAAALDPLGWGLTAGDTADIGVGGLTLGGGIGWLVRRHGLAIDNLVGARVVTAGSSRPPPRSTRTCSGRSAGVGATSAWSSTSTWSPRRSPRCTSGRSPTRSTTLPSC